MATIHLPSDFKEFLKLLSDHQVEYLLIGGYAVGYHGYPQATADMDIWVAMNPANAERIVIVLKEFGFDLPELSPELFLKEWQIIRMGVPPIRIELATTVSGVNFNECYAERVVDTLDGIEVNLISLKDLKLNKKACGRHRDFADLENLPQA
jgi:predicted nucleotidyltransferase